MYKVILVDDEPAILNSLSNDVYWEEYGFDTVKCFTGGEKALYYLNYNTVDLLITDIKMPQMSGINLMRKVNEKYPNVRYMVLTAYDEFEYVREALRLGAENYLLKPINIEELNYSIRKTLDNFNNYGINRSTVNVSYGVFKDNLLSRWLLGNIEANELRERAGIMGINIFCRNYCVVLIKSNGQSSKTDIFLDKVKCCLSGEYNCCYVSQPKGIKAYIIGGKQINCYEIKEKLKTFTSIYCDYLSTFIAIGSVVSNSKELYLSYYAAYNAIKSLAVYPLDSIKISDGVQKTTTARFDILDSEYTRTIAENYDKTNNISPVIERVLSYIHEHYQEPITLKYLSSVVSINTSYLGYLFKIEVGEYFSDYLNKIRMKHAETLLALTEQTVNAIASQIGFNDTSYFNKCFKKIYGISPVKYRHVNKETD